MSEHLELRLQCKQRIGRSAQARSKCDWRATTWRGFERASRGEDDLISQRFHRYFETRCSSRFLLRQEANRAGHTAKITPARPIRTAIRLDRENSWPAVALG